MHLSDEELKAAHDEYAAKLRAESKERELERQLERAEARKLAWAKLKADLGKELPATKDMDEDALYTIYSSLRDFYEWW